MPLFAMAATVIQGPATCTLVGYRVAVSKEEARGSFLAAVQEKKPGYAVLDLLATQVPADLVAQVAVEPVS